MMKFCVVSLGLFALSAAHSWMSCPPSFDTSPSRGGNIVGPCEREGRKKIVTEVKAGDRLKVGWTSNNHAGGWVRLALVPDGQHKVYEHFEQNVLKIVCYGHDERKGKSSYGDCVHPCNARKGCEYMANKYDGNRYDTTIKIPYNLPDGVYILQYMSAMSAHRTFYYSCARIQISGGNPSLPCKRAGAAPVAYGCMKGMSIPLSKYTDNTKMGNFCFAKKGLGDQDADMSRVPVNPSCDPRITCQLSVQYKRCMAADNNMKDITNAWDPQQVCKGEIVPPPEPTCEDGIKNNGELMVDCGGPNCDACYEEPTEPADDRIYSKLDFTQKDWVDGNINIRAVVKISKDANDWRYTMFFTKAVEINDAWGCKKLSVNEFKTIWTFGPMPWTKKVRPGQTINLGFNGRFEADGEAPQTVTKSFVEYVPDAF